MESHWKATGIGYKLTSSGTCSANTGLSAPIFAGGNMFVYYSLEQARKRDYKGPDFFVVLGVDGVRPRHSWIVWQEQGRYPDVIVELLSPTTISQDLGPKKDLYERVFKTSE
jgi:Uma2 family endonuclease